MNTGAKAVAYGIGGLALAGLVIFSGMALGVISASPVEAVSILLTDPPSVPDGVTAVYLTYSNFSIHGYGLGDAGWVNMQGHGTIDTLGLVNLSQTVSTGTVPSLKYNLVRFNVTSAVVTYLGKNYSATVNSGKLTVPITGGLQVVSTHSSAALVDVQVTVLNLGSQSSPEFVVATGGRAVQVPSGEVSDEMSHVGYKYGLSNHTWFQGFEDNHSSGLALGAISLSPDSLSFSATNEGSDPVTLRLVIISSYLGAKPSDTLANSVVLIVNPDGSLTPFKAGQVGFETEDGGYQLAGGATVNFSFSGALSTLVGRTGISSGSTYYFELVGSEALVTQTVRSA